MLSGRPWCARPWCARPWCARPWCAGQWCAFACHLSILMVSTGVLCAQDPFEIHVLEYEQLQPGEFTFENHMNYVAPNAAQGAAPGTQSIFHDTYELTAGVTDNVAFGIMQLNARRPDGPLESAGWRLVPHLYAPRSWHLPVDLGLVVEFAFENPAWDADTRSVTLVPILEKRFGRVQIDLNPTFDRPLRGPDIVRGWGLGLAARVGFDGMKRFTPSLEYYGDWGPLPAFEPFAAQMHQILPGGDIRLRKNIIWSLGIGMGITPATDRIVYKSRLEISFGGKARH
jgi:hypothetical protein